MVLVTNNFIACGARDATLTTSDGSSYVVKVRNRPEVQETVEGFPYVVRKSGFLANVPPVVVPMVGDTLTHGTTTWNIGKVVFTPYQHHYGLSTVAPSFPPSQQRTLKLYDTIHTYGCDAQDIDGTEFTEVSVVLIHNNSTELIQNDALTFAESWRLYIDQVTAALLDHDSRFTHESKPGLFYQVRSVVDIGRLDRLPYALCDVVA